MIHPAAPACTPNSLSLGSFRGCVRTPRSVFVAQIRNLEFGLMVTGPSVRGTAFGVAVRDHKRRNARLQRKTPLERDHSRPLACLAARRRRLGRADAWRVTINSAFVQEYAPLRRSRWSRFVWTPTPNLAKTQLGNLRQSEFARHHGLISLMSARERKTKVRSVTFVFLAKRLCQATRAGLAATRVRPAASYRLDEPRLVRPRTWRFLNVRA